MHGGTDCKLTSGALAPAMQTWAICGPTHEQQPVFSFEQWPGVPHYGTPVVFDFDWVLMGDV